jgi:hypothetical protein
MALLITFSSKDKMYSGFSGGMEKVIHRKNENFNFALKMHRYNNSRFCSIFLCYASHHSGVGDNLS